MRGHPDEVEQALVALASAVTRQLSAHDWQRRLIEEHAIAILTKPTGNGILAVVEISRASRSWPADWPIDLCARVGAGYEPALNLMPVLTLPPRPLMAASTWRADGDRRRDGDEQGQGEDCIVTLTGLDTVSSGAKEIIDFVEQSAAGIADTFPTASALQAACPDAESRLVLLAAMGRHDEMLVSAGKDTIELVRHSSESNAAWLQPPERASYPMVADNQRRTAVELEPSATQWIERILAEALWRVGPCVLLRVWLASDERTGALAVFIGDQRVGYLRPEVSGEFDQVMHDAAAFDEDPFVTSTLTEVPGITPALLEVPLPRRQAATLLSPRTP